MVKTKKDAARNTPADWEEAALDALASGGPHSVSIPTLAKTLGVTKGSFYWHFAGFDALITAALERWEARDRAALEALEVVADPRERLEALFREAVEAPQAHALFVSLSGSAMPEVSAALRRVSERRIGVLATAYRELGFDTANARQRAVLVYSAYVGLLYLRHEALPAVRGTKAIDAYVAHAVATLIPAKKR